MPQRVPLNIALTLTRGFLVVPQPQIKCKIACDSMIGIQAVMRMQKKNNNLGFSWVLYICVCWRCVAIFIYFLCLQTPSYPIRNPILYDSPFLFRIFLSIRARCFSWNRLRWLECDDNCAETWLPRVHWVLQCGVGAIGRSYSVDNEPQKWFTCTYLFVVGFFPLQRKKQPPGRQ